MPTLETAIVDISSPVKVRNMPSSPSNMSSGHKVTPTSKSKSSSLSSSQETSAVHDKPARTKQKSIASFFQKPSSNPPKSTPKESTKAKNETTRKLNLEVVETKEATTSTTQKPKKQPRIHENASIAPAVFASTPKAKLQTPDEKRQQLMDIVMGPPVVVGEVIDLSSDLEIIDVDLDHSKPSELPPLGMLRIPPLRPMSPNIKASSNQLQSTASNVIPQEASSSPRILISEEETRAKSPQVTTANQLQDTASHVLPQKALSTPSHKTATMVFSKATSKTAAVHKKIVSKEKIKIDVNDRSGIPVQDEKSIMEVKDESAIPASTSKTAAVHKKAVSKEKIKFGTNDRSGIVHQDEKSKMGGKDESATPASTSKIAAVHKKAVSKEKIEVATNNRSGIPIQDEKSKMGVKDESATPASTSKTAAVDKTAVSKEKIKFVTNVRSGIQPEKSKMGGKDESETPASDLPMIILLDTPTDVKCDVPKSGDKNDHNIAAMSKDRLALLDKHQTLRSQYERRSEELIQRGREGLEDEDFIFPQVAVSGTVAVTPGDFPDGAVPSLAAMVQESHLSLSSLTAKAMEHLKLMGVELTAVAVSSKIKVLATRESYNGQASSESIHVFEDTSLDRMWRWEVISLELLPEESIANVKKARSSRKKLRNHLKALKKLLSSLEEADKLLKDNLTTQDKVDLMLTKVSNDEEKVLKFEREEEKARLLDEAKKVKEEAKMKKQLEKQKEKDLKQKEKEGAEEQKRKEKEQKRLEAAKVREELKRKREVEEKKELLVKEQQLEKQRSRMISFFASGKSQSHSPNRTRAPRRSDKSVSSGFDTGRFWSQLNRSPRDKSAPLFEELSALATASRKRRTKKVSVPVYVTAMPSDGFHAQPYAERKVIEVPNKFKYLSFHEDCRPPYYGTWSKPKSSTVTGKNPLGKDIEYLDYEVDSEAEWEEGDDELGEDCEEDAADDDDENMDDDEGDTRVYNYQDGWLAADDDLGPDDEDIDEETRMLRKKKLQAMATESQNEKRSAVDRVTVCIIAPGMGGLPLIETSAINQKDLVEGVELQEALGLVSSHTGEVLTLDDLCLDAFPPALVDEGVISTSESPTSAKNGLSVVKPPANQEMSRDDLKTFAQFVHLCTLPSKDRLVEELRRTHTKVTSSRAQATRTLHSIAAKKRHPSGGVVWEVKPDVLENLGLEELVAKQPEVREETKKVVTVSKSETNQSTVSNKEMPCKASPPGPEETMPTKSPPTDVTKAKESGKKRKLEVSLASAKLFAGFLQKRAKTDDVN